MQQQPASYTAFAQKGVILMLSLLAYFVGLLGTFALIVGGLMYIAVALKDHRLRSLPSFAGILCGYTAGVLFVGALVPHDWTLPFWTTLAAAGNAAKYGHPVEHYAEGIVAGMMFCGVVGAVIGGSVTHIAGTLLRQRKVGQGPQTGDRLWSAPPDRKPYPIISQSPKCLADQ